MSKYIWTASQGTAVRADRIGETGSHFVYMEKAMKHNGGSRVFRQRKAKLKLIDCRKRKRT